MKSMNALGIVSALTLSFSTLSHAVTVLIIDVTNPSAVTFTSTNGASASDSSLAVGTVGFTIENFLINLETLPSLAVAGNLSVTRGSVLAAYDTLGTFAYGSSNTALGLGDDLSLFSSSTGNNTPSSQIFENGQRAFSGVATADFSSIASSLPAAGTTGSVITGFESSGVFDHGELIGEWTVVPEPSSSFMALAGLSLLGLSRRRK